jgi:hypothetical protein
MSSSSEADPAMDDNFPVREAARKGHLEVIRFVLTLPAVDPAARSNEAIRMASENGHLEVVKILIGDLK